MRQSSKTKQNSKTMANKFRPDKKGDITHLVIIPWLFSHPRLSEASCKVPQHIHLPQQWKQELQHVQMTCKAHQGTYAAVYLWAVGI